MTLSPRARADIREALDLALPLEPLSAEPEDDALRLLALGWLAWHLGWWLLAESAWRRWVR